MIDAEYEFVKKRAMINFLTNSKLYAEASFHGRAVNMLKQIQMYENNNLKNKMRDIAMGSVNKVLAMVDDPEHAGDIRRASFESALDGIRTGVMTYEGDNLLPLIQADMEENLSKFQGLSAAEEREILKLSPDQRRAIADNDKK